MIDRRLFTNFDWGFLFLVLLIAGIGVVNIASATASYTSQDTSYAIKQIYWILIGLFIVIQVCSIDYHLFADVAYWFYGVLMVLLLVVLFVGKTTMGATRWLDLGCIQFPAVGIDEDRHYYGLCPLPGEFYRSGQTDSQGSR